MNKLYWAVLLVGLPLLLASGETDPGRIMQTVDDQSAGRTISLKATFDVYQANGPKQQKRIQVLELNTGGTRRTLLRFLSPSELKGVALLSVDADRLPKQQWFYTPALQRVRPVGEREQSESFAGTDFTYEDLQPAPVTSFTYKLLSSSEKMDGHNAYKLEKRRKNPAASQYAYSYVWVAQDIPCVLFEAMYGDSGQPVRTRKASQFKRVSGLWGARRVEMRTVATNSRTVLTIEEADARRELTPQMFTPEALSGSVEAVEK